MRSLLYSSEDVSHLQRKVSYLYLVVLVFVLLVLLRLFFLQVIRGSSYRLVSEQISIRESELVASRGLVLDRNGKILAENRPYYEVVAIPQYLENPQRTVDSLALILSLSSEEMLKTLSQAAEEPLFQPVTLVQDVPYDWISRLSEYQRPGYDGEAPVFLQGVEVKRSPLRYYFYPELFSHALGYLTEVDRKNLKNFQEQHPGRYSWGDLIGASALEKKYDLQLRGHDGVFALVVDARGRAVEGNPDLTALEEQSSSPPRGGETLVTTLDFEAQKKAAEALGERRGAVVALDPRNGEVLVFYSSPGFDPNRLVKNVDHDYWRHLNFHEDKHLFNRAVQGTYPPGSTYKIVPAVAGLAEGVIDEKSRFYCGGGFRFGDRTFRCWKGGGHGSIPLVSAIEQSCDVFFYQLGLKVGVDRLKKYASLLGMGRPTGIDLPFEEEGLIPSSDWKLKKLGQPWIESETISLAIGQGYDAVTPLQNAVMAAMIANGGRPFKPHLAKKITDAAGKVLWEWALLPGKPVIPDRVIQTVKEGMIKVVHGNGTARRLKESPFKIAGKTGTAQVIGEESKVRRTERTKDHAWFVAFAPYDAPKIAVSVLVENGGFGAAAAAPVAQAVIEEYLGKK